MGVDRINYVMLAVRLLFDEVSSDEEKYNEYLDTYEDEGYSSEITKHNGLTMVSDGMNGEYAFIGEVITKTMDFEGLSITDCSVKEKDIERIKFLIMDQFEIPSPDVKVWAFTHSY